MGWYIKGIAFQEPIDDGWPFLCLAELQEMQNRGLDVEFEYNPFLNVILFRGKGVLYYNIKHADIVQVQLGEGLYKYYD